MLQLWKELSFVEDGVYAFFGDYFGLIHLFHGVKNPVFFHHYAPHFAEPSFPNNIVEFEVRAADFNIINF